MSLNPNPVFSYNPSAWSQRIPIALLGGIAFFIALYLGLFQWGLISEAWDPLFGDGTRNVLTSAASHDMTKWIHMPDAALGSFAYLGDAIYALAGSTRRWQDRPWLVILFGIDVIPLGVVSSILVGVQGFVVGSWCFLCLMTALISLILVYLAYDEVCASCLFLHQIWKLSRSKKQTFRAFCGKFTPYTHDAAQTIIRSKNVAKNP
jgi:hypothetical protein